ncbi:hypothetical protein Tco_0187572, partial [Tanacetum coccineum]
ALPGHPASAKRFLQPWGIVPTEMELVLEQTQQGTSHEVSIADMDPVTHHLELKRFSSHVSIILLIITGGLDSALDLNNLLSCLMNNLQSSELIISNLSPADG